MSIPQADRNRRLAVEFYSHLDLDDFAAAKLMLKEYGADRLESEYLYTSAAGRARSAAVPQFLFERGVSALVMKDGETMRAWAERCYPEMLCVIEERAAEEILSIRARDGDRHAIAAELEM